MSIDQYKKYVTLNPKERLIRDQLKLFIKIGKINIKPNVEYISVNQRKNKITFMDDKCTNNNQSKRNYNFDKVFLPDDEYSYIYEHITDNCISQAIIGINHFFLSYGKKSSE